MGSFDSNPIDAAEANTPKEVRDFWFDYLGGLGFLGNNLMKRWRAFLKSELGISSNSMNLLQKLYYEATEEDTLHTAEVRWWSSRSSLPETALLHEHQLDVLQTSNPFVTFTPDDVSGLAWWLEADAITDGTTGQVITTWPDSSVNGIDATSIGTVHPEYHANALNGQPIVRFSGSANVQMRTMREGVLVPNSQAFSIFVVARKNAAATQASILERDPQTLTNEMSYVSGPFGDTFQILSQPAEEGDQLSLRSDDFSVNLFNVLTVVGSFDGEGYVAKTYIDGIVGASTDSYDVTIAFNSISRIGLSKPMYGEIAEIIVYNEAVSDLDRVKIEDYLAEKYGLV